MPSSQPQDVWEQYRAEPLHDRGTAGIAFLAGLPLAALVVASFRIGLLDAILPWLLFTGIYAGGVLGAFQAGWGLGGGRARGSGDAVTVTPAGIRPTLAEPGVVPAAHLAGVEVRRWSTERGGHAYLRTDECSVSLRLTDGRFVALPALSRPEGPERPVRLMVSTSGRPLWTPVAGPDADPADWTRRTDPGTAAELERRFRAVLDPSRPPAPATAAELSLSTLEGLSGQRHRDGRDDRVRRISVPLPPPR